MASDGSRCIRIPPPSTTEHGAEANMDRLNKTPMTLQASQSSGFSAVALHGSHGLCVKSRGRTITSFWLKKPWLAPLEVPLYDSYEEMAG
jgi:hypothetical protein